MGSFTGNLSLVSTNTLDPATYNQNRGGSFCFLNKENISLVNLIRLLMPFY